MALIDNLTAYWTMDEASGTREDSTASNIDLTDVNTVGSAAGIINNGADFEETNDEYFSVADGGGVDPSGAFSFSFWIKYEELPSSGQDDGWMGKWSSTGNQRSFAIGGYNNAGTQQAYFLVTGDGSSNVGSFSNSGISAGNWYHIVAIYSPSSYLDLYVNDTRIQNVTSSVPASIFNSTAEFRIADYVTATTTFDGVIDEVGYWSRAITSAEVTELYNGGAGLAYPFTGGGATNHNLLLMGVGT
jgi:hypothetical protein